jgi:hypothetical protein
MPQGNYSFSETAPPGTVFDLWECYEVISGNAIGPISTGKTPTVDLTGTKQITCKAIYTLAPAPTLPKLAITSEFPPGYTGPTANLTATSTNNDTCVEAPSTQLNETAGITIVNPGPGFCREDGSMPPGNYTLTQVSPPGVVFDRFECFEIVNGTAVPIMMPAGVDLSGNKTVSCKAVYVFAPR